ncbi:MAG: ABC transporter substrate-binding protein, partial [Cyanobacteriota bacterium]|nr:ABC transporter substrate-binding protein [Cyanobacteriota bacterium]
APNDPETLIYLNNAVAKEVSKINLLPISKSLTACSLPNNVGSNNQNNKLKIAAPVPIATEPHIARDILRGIAQAQNEINCNGGINGELLQVMIVDDEDKKSVVIDVAKKLVENLNILAVAGHYSSSSTLQAGKIYNGKIVAVSPTSNAFRKSRINPNGLDFSEWVFRVPPSVVKDLAEYMIDTKKFTKAAVAYIPNREWSKSTYQEFENYLKAKGSKIVHKCELNSNFRARRCLNQAIKQEAEVMLLLPEIVQNTIDKASVLFEANYNRSNQLLMLGGTTMYGDKILRKSAENMVTGIYWHRNKIKPSKFESDAFALWNAKINGRSAMGYDTTMVIAEGLRLMDNNPTREGLKQVLSNPSFSATGAAGKVEFDENFDRKITSENDAEIGVLVQVKCDNAISSSCRFVRVSQQ